MGRGLPGADSAREQVVSLQESARAMTMKDGPLPGASVVRPSELMPERPSQHPVKLGAEFKTPAQAVKAAKVGGLLGMALPSRAEARSLRNAGLSVFQAASADVLDGDGGHDCGLADYRQQVERVKREYGSVVDDLQRHEQAFNAAERLSLQALVHESMEVDERRRVEVAAEEARLKEAADEALGLKGQ